MTGVQTCALPILQLVGEQQAQRPLFRSHLGAHQPGSLPLQAAAGVHAQEVADVWRSEREAEVRVCGPDGEKRGELEAAVSGVSCGRLISQLQGFPRLACYHTITTEGLWLTALKRTLLSCILMTA